MTGPIDSHYTAFELAQGRGDTVTDPQPQRDDPTGGRGDDPWLDQQPEDVAMTEADALRLGIEVQ
jgi:hypothetical protein